jgi:hypothetical protein
MKQKRHVLFSRNYAKRSCADRSSARHILQAAAAALHSCSLCSTNTKT